MLLHLKMSISADFSICTFLYIFYPFLGISAILSDNQSPLESRWPNKENADNLIFAGLLGSQTSDSRLPGLTAQAGGARCEGDGKEFA